MGAEPRNLGWWLVALALPWLVHCAGRAEPDTKPEAAAGMQAAPVAPLDDLAVGLVQTMLSAELHQLQRQSNLAAEAQQHLQHVRLKVFPEQTRVPSAEATLRARGGSVEVDAAFFWSRREQFALAAMSLHARQQAQSYAARSALDYRAQCAAAALRDLPRPPLKLDHEGRFGQLESVLSQLPAAVREKVANSAEEAGRTMMAFVLIHELGHILLRHQRNGLAAEASRAQEHAADEFAFAQLTGSGHSLTTLRATLRTEAMLQDLCRDAGYRFSNNHPTWRQRANRLTAWIERSATSAVEAQPGAL